MSFSRKRPRYSVHHDSEWSDRVWLSTTIEIVRLTYNRGHIHTTQRLELVTYANHHFTEYVGERVELIYSHFEIRNRLLALLAKHQITVTYMDNFFSPTDIYYIFPTEFPSSLHKNQIEPLNDLKLTQRSVIRGRLVLPSVIFIFRDFSGLLGITSLKVKLHQLGLSTMAKTSADDFKSKMHLFLRKHPLEFFQYAESDVVVLPIVKQRYQKLLNEICKALSIRSFEIPLTIGTTVSQIIQSQIEADFSDYPLKEILTHNSQKGFIREHGKNPSLRPLGFITGGRCNNERPREFFCESAHDIDISQCYTNIMNEMFIPMHKFSVYENVSGFTIQQFLNNHVFYENYYVILFDAYLTFDQDVFPTKIITDSISEEETFSEQIKNLIYFEREIKRGILTHDLLKILYRFWTVEQVEEFMSIKFTSIIYYSADVSFPVFPLSKTIQQFRRLSSMSGTPIALVSKLIINTIYGVMCSPYFKVGNVLIANMITAKARSQVYTLKKKFNLFQTITDGGLAPSDYDDTSIVLDFPITYKARFVKAFFLGKADYIYEGVAKLRGSKNTETVKYRFFESQLNSTPFYLSTRLYSVNTFYKIGAYNHEQNSAGYLYSKHHIIGSERTQYKLFTLNANHTKFKDIETYLTYRRITEKRLRCGLGLFEQLLNTHTMKDTVDLINNQVYIPRCRNRIVSSNLTEVKKFRYTKKRDILHHLFFELPNYHPAELLDRRELNIGYSNYIDMTILKDFYPHAVFYYIPSSSFHKNYYNNINININKPLITHTIEFTDIRTLQNESVITKTIEDTLMNQKDYFISMLYLVFSRTIIDEDFARFIQSTVFKTMHGFKYRIYFRNSQTGRYYTLPISS